MSETLASRLQADAYEGYAYAYPHKLAYRRLDPPVPLAEAWANEDKARLFLYVHLPFCAMRCGFCNLFTTSRPDGDFVDATLAAMLRQSRVVAEQVQPERIAQVAFGGGTPSYLSTPELVRLFEGLTAHWPVDWQGVPLSFETSPDTLDREKLQTLKALGVDRLSIGIQSFERQDVRAMGRPQKNEVVFRTLEAIRDTDFAVLNLDLIYGAQGQTPQSWLDSLDEALRWAPEELYLYPLYVRPLTGLGRTDKSPSERRRELYRLGRDRLIGAGYEQVSMRLFRRAHSPAVAAEYACQDDGMVGLGPGARSYTRHLHYSSEYAVGARGTRRIIQDFNARGDAAFGFADWGTRVEEGELQRRWVMKSLLRAAGLDLRAYHERFGGPVQTHLPQLDELANLGLATQEAGRLRLTAGGLERTDTIGPWLYSDAVQALMDAGVQE